MALKQEKITEFGVTRRREKKGEEEYTQDGSVDRHGRPAIKAKSGGWQAGILLLGIILTQILPTNDTMLTSLYQQCVSNRLFHQIHSYHIKSFVQ